MELYLAYGSYQRLWEKPTHLWLSRPQGSHISYGHYGPPLLFALQQHIEAPMLDPRRKETSVTFEESWAEWSKYQLYGAPGGVEGDIMKRDLLLTRVHSILREQLREVIAQRPSTTFHDVWDHLKSILAWTTRIIGSKDGWMSS